MRSSEFPETSLAEPSGDAENPTGAIDAVVAGLICLDFTPVFDHPPISRMSEIFRPASTVIVRQAVMNPGGCVSNTGLAMSHFGAKTALVAKIGKDAFGDRIFNHIARYTSTDYLLYSEEGTAYSVVLAPPGIDRMFLHCPAGNDTFSADDIDYSLVSRARLFHFGYPTIMKRMYEQGGEELTRMYARVKALGVTTSLDSCGIDPLSPVGRINWELILERTIPFVDIFMPSAEELCYMLDRERLRDWKERAGGGDVCTILEEGDVRPLAARLLALGAGVVCVKCGACGYYVAAGTEERLASVGKELAATLRPWNGLRHFEASYKPDRVLSSLGAGDVSIAAFLTSLLDGCDWRTCVRRAVAAGAACVESYSVLDGLPTLAALEDRIAAGWEKNDV